MTYADLLHQRFPDLNPRVDDLFLLEAHQIAELPDRAPSRELAAVLHAYPLVQRYFVVRLPAIREFLMRVLTENDPAPTDELPDHETALLWEIADWIVYQRAPQRLDEGSVFDPGLTALDDIVALDDQVVVDAGAGTGQVAFAAAPVARHVFAVEPVAALRAFMRDKAERLDLDNVFVLDGVLHSIPLPAGSADILITRQAIGWALDDELPEIERVLRPVGVAVHLYGMPHPAPPDDEIHRKLVADGYRPGTYREGATVKRKYWKRFADAR